MGGEVGVNSAYGKGSEFFFRVFFKKGAGPSVGKIKHDIKILKGLRVIVVDDNNTNTFILEDCLSSVGCHMRTAGSVDEAIAVIKTASGTPASVQLIITDVMMRGKSGYDLAAEMRRDRRFDNVPIVFADVGERAG
jgi:hypothetical protein